MSNRLFVIKFILVVTIIISCIHLFSSYHRKIYSKQTPKKIITYYDLEKSLCLVKYQNNKLLDSKECPLGIVTAKQAGRLGNQIWEYASVWAASKETGLYAYVPKCIKSTLEVLFDNLSIMILDEIFHCPVLPTVSIKYMNDYDNKTKKSITFQKYIVQAELISKYYKDIIREFSINRRLLKESQNILHSVVKSLNKTFNTFIGIHIRRTDYIQYIRNKYKVKPADIKFYKSAIKYFENKYKRPIFIVITDDPLWSMNKFDSLPNVYVKSKSNEENYPELDMAILASCNHSIIDYGTFGQWGALLAGGETIYYKVNQTYSSERLSKVIPKWHTL